MIRTILAAVVLAGAGAAATASAAATAPAAATGPAAAADFSSPKGAAKTLFAAISDGDRDTVRAALYAADEAQRDLVDAMADLLVNGKHLGDAAQQQFGKAGDPIGRGMLDPADLPRLDPA